MRYAAYGSNLHPLRLKERAPSAQLLGTSHLPDWSLHFHKRSKDKSGKCNILQQAGGVFLAVFDISNEDRLRLNQIEGLGHGYAEGTLSIPNFGSCVTYFAQISFIDNELQPYDWYREIVLLGCMRLGFPPEYLSMIGTIPTIEDPDTVRRDNNWRTVEMLRRNC